MTKGSFFERLTGSVKVDQSGSPVGGDLFSKSVRHELPQPNDEEAQLTVDVSQTPNEIIVQSVVGGVRPDDLEVEVTHDMVTIRGKREKGKEIAGNDYFYQELYWGVFARSILLPQEIDADEAEATLKNGLLTLRLPKLDKSRSQKVKIKSSD